MTFDCQNVDQRKLVILCLLHNGPSGARLLWDQEAREPTPHAYELAEIPDPEDPAEQALVRLALTIWDGEARLLDLTALNLDQFASVARLLVAFAERDLDSWLLDQLGESADSA